MNKPVKLKQYVHDLICDASPTKEERNSAVAGHVKIRAVLDALQLSQNTFLSGSYARKTHCRPINDVDVFVALDASQKDNDIASKVLQHLQTAFPEKNEIAPSSPFDRRFIANDRHADV